MNISTAKPQRRLFSLTQLGRDYAFVLPGFFISLFAFVILVPLTALSVGTLIIWIGALLLPLTLYIASAFAELSRVRVRHWVGHSGRHLLPVTYAPATPGVMGFIKQMGDPRRWLDLAFETLVAFPLRTFTFVVATTWTAGAVGGVTYSFWGIFVPRDEHTLIGVILESATHGTVPHAVAHSFGLDAAFNFSCGIVFLVTLPLVMRCLAHLDAAATTAALGGSEASSAPESPGDFESPGTATGVHAATGSTAGSARDTPTIGETRPARTSHTVSSARRPEGSVSGVGWAWIAVVTTAIVSIAVSWPTLSVLYEVHAALAMCLALSSAAALVLVVRWPFAGIALQLLALVATAILTSGASDPFWPWPWPVMALILQTILVLVVSLRHSWLQAIAAWVVPQIGVLVVMLAIGVSPGAVSNMIVSASVTLGTLAIGFTIRQLVVSRSALREEQRASADLSVQQRELQERNRIAQELHDVVAHSMSVISVQATTAKYRLPGMDSETEQEFQSIAASSRQALTEMRGLLTMLRSPNSEAALAPQPELADIPALIQATESSGARIMFNSEPSEGAWASVPSTTGLVAYRIVQEALSNAVRHAPGAEITVSVVVAEGHIAVDVINGRPAGGAPAEPAPGAGLGLSGVQERTAALGGRVTAAPDASGGFQVSSVLPLTPHDAPNTDTTNRM
ncbi:MAG: sensor histidine kinase [Leucobacter sp.]